MLIENYNYIFNSQVQTLLAKVEDGSLGRIVHVEVRICLPIFAADSPFADRNLPHSLRAMRGGAIADFLPHLASLAHAFVGGHRRVATLWRKASPSAPEDDEFRALIEAERGTALVSFSANAEPLAFTLVVEGTRMRATANLFETRLILEELLSGPQPLLALRNGLREARMARRAAFGSLWRKLGGGPGAYEGLWELLRRTYRALETKSAPPIAATTVREVNDMVEAFVNEENRL
jgi:predicted dehydrogenase